MTGELGDKENSVDAKMGWQQPGRGSTADAIAELARLAKHGRPDHAGRPVRFEHRNETRTEAAEMFAVHTPDEHKAVLDRIEAEGRGQPIGEQMLADAHGRPDEGDRPNHSD